MTEQLSKPKLKLKMLKSDLARMYNYNDAKAHNLLG